jgi:hypothetical protein
MGEAPKLSLVAMSLAQPGKNPAFRLNDGYSAAKSAVANTYQEILNNWSPTGTNVYMAGFFFRDPLRWAMIADSNPLTLDSEYTALWGTDNTFAPAVPPGTEMQVQPDYWFNNAGYATNEWQPHGPKLYSGQWGSDVFTWFDANVNLQFVNSAQEMPEGTAGANIFFWTGQTKRLYVTLYFTSAGVWAANAVFNYKVLDPGYYVIELFNRDVTSAAAVNTAPLSVGINLNGYNLCNLVWRQLTLPDYDANSSSTTSIRMQSKGVTLRNTTAYEYENGRACIKQMNKGDDPLHYVNDGFPLSQLFNEVSALQDAQTVTFKKSLYFYLKPHEWSDFQYQYSTATNVPYGNAFPYNNSGYFTMKPQNDWLLVVAQVSAATNGISTATTSQLRIEDGVQFLTNNTWQATDVAVVSQRMIEEACFELQRVPQIYAGEVDGLLIGVNG